MATTITIPGQCLAHGVAGSARGACCVRFIAANLLSQHAVVVEQANPPESEQE